MLVAGVCSNSSRSLYFTVHNNLNTSIPTFFSILPIYLVPSGESEKNAKAVFALARRLAPCVVYLDEVDSILSSREQVRGYIATVWYCSYMYVCMYMFAYIFVREYLDEVDIILSSREQ